MTDRSGSILITVVVLISVLTLISLNFFYSARTELKKTGIAETKTRCRFAAESALNFIKNQLKEDRTPGYDWKYDFWYKKKFFFSYDNINVEIIIEDEDSKINLNNLFYVSNEINVTLERQMRTLLELKSVEEDLTDILIDGIPENKRINSLSELLTFEKYGDYFKADGWGDTDNLFNYFTVYGENKFNINTVDMLILESLTDSLNEIEIGAIKDFRDKYGFKKVDDLKKVYELSDESYQIIDGYLKVKSDILRLNIRASLNNVNYIIIQVIDKRSKPVKTLYRVVI